MCDCDDNPPAIYEAEERRARKPHRCSECRRTIEPGERYEAVRGLWDGRWSAFSICAHCRAAATHIGWLVQGEFCWCFGGLWESARDLTGGGFGVKSMAISRLIVGAKRRWTHRRGERKGRPMPIPTRPIGATVRV